MEGAEAGDLAIKLVLTRRLLSLPAIPLIFLPALTSLADGKAMTHLLIGWKIYLMGGELQASFLPVWQVTCYPGLGLRAGGSFVPFITIQLFDSS